MSNWVLGIPDLAQTLKAQAEGTCGEIGYNQRQLGKVGWLTVSLLPFSSVESIQSAACVNSNLKVVLFSSNYFLRSINLPLPF